MMANKLFRRFRNEVANAPIDFHAYFSESNNFRITGTDFRETLYWRLILKFVGRLQFWLQSDNNKGALHEYVHAPLSR
jgi:hypothetical protein